MHRQLYLFISILFQAKSWRKSVQMEGGVRVCEIWHNKQLNWSRWGYVFRPRALHQHTMIEEKMQLQYLPYPDTSARGKSNRALIWWWNSIFFKHSHGHHNALKCDRSHSSEHMTTLSITNVQLCHFPPIHLLCLKYICFTDSAHVQWQWKQNKHSKVVKTRKGTKWIKISKNDYL